MSNKAFNNTLNKSLIGPSGKKTALLDSQLSAKLKIIKKKKVKRQLLISRLNALKSAAKTPRAQKSLILPLIVINLI